MEKRSIPFKPLFARVLLEREEVSEVRGIIIPESARSRYSPAEGVVVSVGEAVSESVRELVGKTVLFARYSGDWIETGGKRFFICQDEDILGVKGEQDGE